MRTYTFMLLFSAAIFAFVAVEFPSAKSEVKKFFNESCTNTTSDLKTVDTLYAASNVQLCSAACPCNITMYNKTVPTGLLPTAAPKLANNFQSCPGTSNVLNSNVPLA